MLARSSRVVGVLTAAAMGSSVVLGLDALSDSADAATPSTFRVVEGSIRTATGTPRPPGGTHASLWNNRSTASTTVEGAGRVQLGAIGDHCGDWPRVEVTVDGRVVGTTRIVDARRYGTYPVGPALPAGRHEVSVRFVNDFRTATCDRNVHIGAVRLTRIGVPASVPPTAAPAAPTPGAPAPRTPAPTAVPTPVPTPAAPPVERPEPPARPVDGPVSPADPPAGDGRPTGSARPGPGTTGVPAGTVLTRHQGDLVVREDGAVIDGLDIHGFLRIEADDVTVRNTRVRGREPGTTLKALVAAYGDHRNFVIEDSTLHSDFRTPYMDGIKGRNFTARRLDVAGVVDNALIFGDNVVIEDSWFHDTRHFTPWAAQPDNQTHNDNLEIVGGRNILVSGNLFEEASNAAIMITQDHSRSADIRVVDNWLLDGDCIVNQSEKGKGPIGASYVGNRFGTSTVANCGILARDVAPPVSMDNVWLDGSPVVTRRRSN